MKNLLTLKALFFFDLKLLRRIFIEFFILIGIMQLFFFFSYTDDKLYMLLPIVTMYILFIFLIVSCIMYLNNEREKGHIIKVYKCLPLNDYDIYLSYIITPFISFMFIYIPCSLLLFFFKDKISNLLIPIKMSFHHFFLLTNILLPLIIIFVLFLFINVFLLLKHRTKKNLKYVYFIILFLFIYGKNIINTNSNFGKRIVFLKQFLLTKESLPYLYITSFLILSLIIIQVIFGMKKFKKIIYEEL